MSNRNSKASLLATTMIGGLAFALPAYAQPAEVQTAPVDQTEATQEDAADTPAVAPGEDSEAIIVTGTRISSPNITSMSPVQVVGETEIDQSGAINVQEVLLENPVFGTPALGRTNSAFLTQAAGTATVDLRDLGSDRTLILINNRRVVAGVPGSSIVDLNVIPTQFVERIDILTGGASSLYGSDAVAGVVNFIYKRNFEGLLAEGQYGITERGDSERYQVSLTGGVNVADGRGNLMVHLGYTKEEGLLSRERKNTRQDEFAYVFFTYEPENLFDTYEPFFSSFPTQGRFDVTGTAAAGDDFTFNPITGELQPCFTTNGTTCGGGAGVGPNGFNRQFYRTLAVPVNRYVFATRGTFELADSINVFAEGTYVKTSSSREIEPFAASSPDVFPNTGRLPIETFVDGVPVLNPFVPAEIAAVATDLDGDGLRDVGFARRLLELGTRNSSATRDFFRIVTGLEGTVFGGWNWDISYNYGQTHEFQSSNGQYNVVNARFAFQAIPDINDDDADGDTTEIICADPVARAQGCVPLNIFGEGSITPEAAEYINAEQSLSNRVTQQVLAANLSGSLFELPAGPFGVAVGAEYRRETSRENWDALTNAGLNAGNATPDTQGKFNVKEAYGEINVPILANQPFAHQLNLRAAGRLSDYSTVGNVKTWNVGADFAPIEALRFRGTYAKSVRAPNIGELFTGPSQTFPPGLSDPCSGIGLTGGGALGDRCRAEPGVLQNIAENGVFTQTQADRQGVSGFNSGNPDLDAERSTSITAGAVFAPRDFGIAALRNLVLSVDYYNIKVKDAIVLPPRQFILNECYEQGDPFFCSLITRFPTPVGSSSAGALEFVNAPSVNAGRLKSEGIDFVAQYRTGLGWLMNGMNLNARVAYTHILDGYLIPVPGAPTDHFAGEIGTAQDRFFANVGVETDTFGFNLSGNYIGPSFMDDQFLEALFGEDFDRHSDFARIKAEFYLDAQARFRPMNGVEIFAGVDNLLDNDAPHIPTGLPFNTTGADTAADVYDIFGRRFYGGVRLRFAPPAAPVVPAAYAPPPPPPPAAPATQTCPDGSVILATDACPAPPPPPPPPAPEPERG